MAYLDFLLLLYPVIHLHRVNTMDYMKILLNTLDIFEFVDNKFFLIYSIEYENTPIFKKIPSD